MCAVSLETSAADPGPGSFLTPGSGMNIPNYISESLAPPDSHLVLGCGGLYGDSLGPTAIFGSKILKFFDADPDPGSRNEKFRIRGEKKFGSGINIKDPQHSWKRSRKRYGTVST